MKLIYAVKSDQTVKVGCPFVSSQKQKVHVVLHKISGNLNEPNSDFLGPPAIILNFNGNYGSDQTKIADLHFQKLMYMNKPNFYHPQYIMD